jgi:uncharacterized protein
MADPIYYGLSYPFRQGTQEFPASATDDQLIRDSLIQLVLTRRGERIMRPDVGSNALAFLFEPNDIVLEQTLRAELRAVITKYEPRVQLQAVDIERNTEEGTLTLTLVYIVLASQTSSSVSIVLPIP